MRFKVTGPHRVGGKRKGQTVELDLSDDQAQALIDAGHVRPVRVKQATEEATDKETPDGEAGIEEPGHHGQLR